jgi:prepilin-type N-terminal cleavage/methylation domain-containing protein
MPLPRYSGGFTLTEILVVSVIVAILSAVAIPVYNGYVKDQRIDAVKNLASAAAVSANVLYRRTGAIPDCGGGDCAGVLNLLLPEQGRYSVTITTDDKGRYVKVVDNQHPEATYTAPF